MATQVRRAFGDEPVEATKARIPVAGSTPPRRSPGWSTTPRRMSARTRRARSTCWAGALRLFERTLIGRSALMAAIQNVAPERRAHPPVSTQISAHLRSCRATHRSPLVSGDQRNSTVDRV
jgi:hypothetical protein